MDVNHTHSGNFIRCEAQLKAAKHHMSFLACATLARYCKPPLTSRGNPIFVAMAWGEYLEYMIEGSCGFLCHLQS